MEELILFFNLVFKTHSGNYSGIFLCGKIFMIKKFLAGSFYFKVKVFSDSRPKSAQKIILKVFSDS